jgi:SAM-dependent methyltransferase
MSGSLSLYRFAGDEAYTRRIMDAYAAFFDRGPVADLGCGRGIFLEALRSRGIEGIGVDTGDEAIAQLERRGLAGVRADALSYLRGASGLAGVFASHLIEHLPPEAAESLISLAAEALAPQGTVVVVTPNMRDFRVLSDIYWLDPTHVRPYPAQLLAAWMESHGLTVDEIGHGRIPHGPRGLPGLALGRLRFGREFGTNEIFVRAHRHAAVAADARR